MMVDVVMTMMIMMEEYTVHLANHCLWLCNRSWSLHLRLAKKLMVFKGSTKDKEIDYVNWNQGFVLSRGWMGPLDMTWSLTIDHCQMDIFA